ncbi:uncharacterized protein LOC134221428 [Armigeres subalbatus]|uniref:uncharacterized protein LOC134221428 n=1 Tax=Armigeres subalbatus TaxID=124917 RepID=UPI002ED21607
MTKITEDAPDYSYFFWKYSGKGPGNGHSGLIFSHLRNASKSISPSKRKFTHRAKKNDIVSISSEIVGLSEQCAQIEATSANFMNITRMMITIQPLHNMLIDSKKGVSSILQVLPHYKSYNGAMIRQAYERMNPSFFKEADLRKLFSLGLMLEKDTYAMVHDDHIRGCLRIMGRLTRKGVKKLRPVIEVEPEEELASPLIRFISESPSALAEQLARYAAYDFENDQKVPPHLINQDEYRYSNSS